jgi:hypothetical protein
MEVTTVVKVSDLTNFFDQLFQLRSEIKQLRESEEQLKAFSIQQTAKMLNLHYNSVRKLILKGKLFAKYLDGDTGKCIVPMWAVKEYLEAKEKSNELLTLNH